jgi:hypothetical protein
MWLGVDWGSKCVTGVQNMWLGVNWGLKWVLRGKKHSWRVEMCGWRLEYVAGESKHVNKVVVKEDEWPICMLTFTKRRKPISR